MSAAAREIVPTQTWRQLAARGASITVAPSTLVTVQAPTAVSADLRAAIAWRVDAMRAQVHAAARMGGRLPTLVAVPGLALPLTPPVVWRGYAEVYGRRVWQERTAQRPRSGLCPSCGEETERNQTGDCMLCIAARVGALRAEGVLGPPSSWTPPPPRDPVAWRAGLYAEIARADPLPPPPRRAAWVCETCGAPNVARRDVEGCGRCELRAADVISLAKLGGGEDEEAVLSLRGPLVQPTSRSDGAGRAVPMRAPVEQDFMQAFRLEVTRSLGGTVRLWRQPAGSIQAARGGAVECAPVGAADLSGIVAPTGVRLEVEMKGARTPTTEAQTRWRESMLERGAVALQLRYDPAVNLEGNAVLACAELARAVAAATCTHPDEHLVSSPRGGVWCVRCGWRNGGRPREVAR